MNFKNLKGAGDAPPHSRPNPLLFVRLPTLSPAPPHAPSLSRVPLFSSSSHTLTRCPQESEPRATLLYPAPTLDHFFPSSPYLPHSHPCLASRSRHPARAPPPTFSSLVRNSLISRRLSFWVSSSSVSLSTSTCSRSPWSWYLGGTTAPCGGWLSLRCRSCSRVKTQGAEGAGMSLCVICAREGQPRSSG